MARVKPKRQGIHIDMTPMSDLAWLLLTFFILTTQFKGKESVTIDTPSSVSQIKLQDKNVMRISIDKDGKYYFSIDEDKYKVKVLEEMGKKNNISFTPEEKAKFKKVADFGVPIKQLKSYLALSEGQRGNLKVPGIPCDSVNHELVDWVFTAYDMDNDLTLGIKGDVNTQYPKFKNVLSELQKKNMNKFQLITDSESKPN